MNIAEKNVYQKKGKSCRNVDNPEWIIIFALEIYWLNIKRRQWKP